MSIPVVLQFTHISWWGLIFVPSSAYIAETDSYVIRKLPPIQTLWFQIDLTLWSGIQLASKLTNSILARFSKSWTGSIYQIRVWFKSALDWSDRVNRKRACGDPSRGCRPTYIRFDMKVWTQEIEQKNGDIAWHRSRSQEFSRGFCIALYFDFCKPNCGRSNCMFKVF